MRAWTFVLAVVAGVSLTAVGEEPGKTEFKPHASGAGRYKCIMPGPVKTETQELKGDRVLTLDSSRLPGQNFVVTYIDIPEGGASSNRQPVSTNAADGLKGRAGKVLSEKAIELERISIPAAT